MQPTRKLRFGLDWQVSIESVDWVKGSNRFKKKKNLDQTGLLISLESPDPLSPLLHMNYLTRAGNSIVGAHKEIIWTI